MFWVVQAECQVVFLMPGVRKVVETGFLNVTRVEVGLGSYSRSPRSVSRCWYPRRKVWKALLR